MKITFFRLRGYIKVLNGMGLDEIILPFDTFKNRIVLIQGENGCSKSTIISALSPNPDSSDSFRTDVIYDTVSGNKQIIEYPAEKEIHYEDIDENGNTNYYSILIQSIVDDSRTKRTTKAYISKNGEELNPNGNVTSFKEIRDSMLGIDPIYLDLSSVSSENRGIVDMIPSERRKYMAEYIGSLDTYNNIFKVISKKVNNLKSYMNTLNSKIYELGNENELRLKLSQLESEHKNLNETRDSLISELSKEETTLAMIDPDGKIQDLYASISDRLGQINLEINKFKESLAQLYSSIKLDDTANINEIEKEIEDTINKHRMTIQSDKSQINSNMEFISSISSTIDSNKNLLLELQSSGIESNVIDAVNEVKSQIKIYEDYLSEEDIKVLDSISLDELNDLRNTLNDFIQSIKCIEDESNEYTFIEAVHLCMSNKSVKEEIESYRQTAKEAELDEVRLTKKMEDISNNLSTISEFNNTRPEKCSIDDCPYIAKYMKLKELNYSESDLFDIEDEIKRLQFIIIDSNSNVSDLTSIDEISNKLNIAITMLYSKKLSISKIDEIKKFLDLDYLKNKLEIHYRFPEFDKVSDLIEKSLIYIDLTKVKEQLKGLESDLKIYKNNESVIESLTKSIDKDEKEYSDREEQIKTFTREYLFLENVVSELESKLIVIHSIIENNASLNLLYDEKSKLKTEFESIKDKIRLVKDKADLIYELKDKLNKVEQAIIPLSDTITQIKFNLVNMMNYQNELKESSDRYDKMVFIRNACSPGNGMGIQSEYIKHYMNDIIIDCNAMLKYMFGGTIQLDVPVINEKQFSIPFLGPNGIVVPDISNGSTAQKCMIGLVFSCVAMMKSSLKYNIPRFDEIDGGLDQENRITFIGVLNQILDFMHCEQCIICSHNTEFDTQSTTRLLCSHIGIRIEQ